MTVLVVSVTGAGAVAAPRILDVLRDRYSTLEATAKIGPVRVAERQSIGSEETRPTPAPSGRSVVGSASTFLVPGAHRPAPVPPSTRAVTKADMPPGSPLVIDALGPVVHSWSILSVPEDRSSAQEAIEEIVVGPSDATVEDDPETVVDTVDRAEAEVAKAEEAKDSRSTSKVVRSVTLRSKPGGRRIGTIARGTQVYVGECDDWCSIEAEGRKGWVYRRYLGKIAPTRT